MAIDRAGPEWLRGSAVGCLCKELQEIAIDCHDCKIHCQDVLEGSHD